MMKPDVGALLIVGATFVLAFVPLQAEASHCSNFNTAGSWAYTYTGTIFTPSGPIPADSVGHLNQDMLGNVIGSQARSVAGNPGAEDISGTVIVNKDCTATASINVFATRTTAAHHDSCSRLRQRWEPCTRDFPNRDAPGRHQCPGGDHARRKSELTIQQRACDR